MTANDDLEQRLRSAFQVVADRTEIARNAPRARQNVSSDDPLLLVLDNDAPARATRRREVVRVAAAALLGAAVTAAAFLASPWTPDRTRVVHAPPILANPAGNVSVNPEIATAVSPRPVISGTDFAGNPLAGADDGQPHVLVVVAHWCPPCQSAVSRLVRLHAQQAFDGITLYGVVSATSPEGDNYPPADWLERQRWPFSTFDDADNRIASALGATALPFYVFVDANGQVVVRLAGDVTDAQLTMLFKALAAGQPLPIAVEGWVPATTVP
jgi:hypothetical protein